MNRISSFFSFIILIIALICSGCPIGTLYYSQMVFCLLSMNVIYMILGKKTKIKKNAFLLVSFLVALIWISMLVNRDNDVFHYLGITLKYFAVVLTFSNLKDEEICKKYVQVIAVIATYSSVFSVVCNLIRTIPASFPIISIPQIGTWAHFQYTYYIWGGYSDLWTSLIRNSAFFREPGVFAMHLTLAEILLMSKHADIKFEQKSRNKIAAILIIAGMTTFSTVGCLGACIFSFMYLSLINKKDWKIIASVIGITVVSIFIFQYSEVLFSKFNVNSTSYASMEDRLNGIKSGLSTWLLNPIFGKGYSFYQSKKIGVSTLFVVDFAGKYGTLFSGIFCYGVIRMLRTFSNTSSNFILVTCMYSMFLFTQGLVDEPIFMMFMLWGIFNKMSEKSKVTRNVK